MTFPVMITGTRFHPSYTKYKEEIISEIEIRVQQLIYDYDGDIKLITGMAQGPDIWLAEIGIAHKLPVHAYVPFIGQEYTWTTRDKIVYNKLMQMVSDVTVVAREPSYNAYLQRNMAMLKDAKHCIVVWDGMSRGTGHAVKNAPKYGVSLDVIDLGDFK